MSSSAFRQRFLLIWGHFCELFAIIFDSMLETTLFDKVASRAGESFKIMVWTSPSPQQNDLKTILATRSVSNSFYDDFGSVSEVIWEPKPI
jgi:hypothetical protein